MRQFALNDQMISKLGCSANRLARILLSAVTSVSFGQTCQTIVVDDNDGLVKSPHSYTLLYETDDVRVLESTILPQSSQSMHSFTRPAILYVQNSVDSKTISPDVTNPIEHQEDKKFRPTVIRIGAPGMYATENLSNHSFHGLRVELKHPGCRLTDTKDDRKPPVEPEGEGVAMRTKVPRILYEDGDVRVSEIGIGTSLHDLASLPSSWPGFYYVVTSGHAGKDDRVASAFPIGSEEPKSSSLKPRTAVHVVRFELKQASAK